MSVFRSSRQQRQAVTGVLLVWLFALFAGIAHACSAPPMPAPLHALAASAGERSSQDASAAGCKQFCKADLPVVTKLPPMDDQPDAQPLIVAVNDVRIVPRSQLAARLAQAAHATSDVPPFLRVTRLRL